MPNKPKIDFQNLTPAQAKITVDQFSQLFAGFVHGTTTDITPKGVNPQSWARLHISFLLSNEKTNRAFAETGGFHSIVDRAAKLYATDRSNDGHALLMVLAKTGHAAIVRGFGVMHTVEADTNLPRDNIRRDMAMSLRAALGAGGQGSRHLRETL